MYDSTKKEIDPLQTIFSDIKKILDATVFKDKEKADANETEDSKNLAELWMNANIKRDTFLTYKPWWDIGMFRQVQNSVSVTQYQKYVNSPSTIPLKFQDVLRDQGRQKFMNEYVETNNYYRTLNGLPPYGAAESDYVYMSEELEERFKVNHIPVHELSTYVQNSYMATDEYKQTLADNPDKEYLNYIGRNKIGVYAARVAKDFDIIRYPGPRNDINPYLLNTFASVYADYREYVMVVLYNNQFESIYKGYRTFMGILILAFTLLQIGNKALETVKTRKYMDDTILHFTLSMYGIPDDLLMTKQVRRDLAMNLLKLVREKGTKDVYYDLIEILGYQDVIISKLMLMKGQQFITDEGPLAAVNIRVYIENGILKEVLTSRSDFAKPDLFINDQGELILAVDDPNDMSLAEEEVSAERFEIRGTDLYVTMNEPKSMGEALDDYEPYFLQLDLKDENPYETITSGRAPIYSYHDIIDGDPMWWDLEDVQKILSESKYTMSDSKYIVIEAVVHQMEYIFEAIYFMRMMLDNKSITEDSLIEVPEIFGTDMIPLYDLILYLICATCMSNGLKGTINTQNDQLLATAGFNFDLPLDLFEEYLSTTEYVDVDRIHKFMESMTINDTDDLSRMFNDVMKPMREWLENHIANASNRQEYIEYESIYRALFTYDVSRNRFLDDYEIPIDMIKDKYNISDEDMDAFAHFYPHTSDGTAINADQFNAGTNSTLYRYPFLSRDNPVDWYIHITIQTSAGTDDRGYLYFYDILNSPDLRYLANPDGSRVFMDYNSDEGWEINQKAVNKAIQMIDALDDDQLAQAYFQIYTRSTGKAYDANEKLPASIRSGAFKSILKDKITMDMDGLADPPATYFEALYRTNTSLYDLLFADDRFNKNKTEWMNDVMSVVLAIETKLSIHLKYFEQSVLGEQLFFKPLITLIKHFKSILVDIAKTGFKYVFDDKMDAGGNSNMLRLFDEMDMTDHVTEIGETVGNDNPFGLYDTIHKETFNIELNDKTELIKYVIGQGFLAQERVEATGALRMSDDVKLFRNGVQI